MHRAVLSQDPAVFGGKEDCPGCGAPYEMLVWADTAMVSSLLDPGEEDFTHCDECSTQGGTASKDLGLI